MAIVAFNTELEDAGAGSKSHILAMPMLSDIMASRDLSQEVVQILVESVSAMRKQPEAQTRIWEKCGPIYEQWLLNFVGKDDGDGREDSQPQEDVAKSAKSTGEPAMSDK